MQETHGLTDGKSEEGSMAGHYWKVRLLHHQNREVKERDAKDLHAIEKEISVQQME